MIGLRGYLHKLGRAPLISADLSSSQRNGFNRLLFAVGSWLIPLRYPEPTLRGRTDGVAWLELGAILGSFIVVVELTQRLVGTVHYTSYLILASLIAGLRLGLIPGLVCAVGGVFLVNAIFLPPVALFALPPGRDVPTLMITAGATILVSIIAQLIRTERAYAQALQRDLERQHSALVNRHEDLAARDQWRAEFSILLARQITTPLTSIIGFADLLDMSWERCTVAQRRQVIRRLRQASHRLMGLTDDLADLSHIDTGTLSLHCQDTALGPLMLEAIEAIQVFYPDLLIDTPDDVGSPLVRVDRDRLIHVIIHLLDNAVQHNPAGAALRVDWRTVRGDVVIAIADEGPGLSAEMREQLFTRTNKRDTPLSEGMGTGIELYLCHQFVERMGGRIWADNRDDLPTGAVFRIAFPLVTFAQ